MNLISKSFSHVGDRFVGDEEGIRDLECDLLLTDKVYKALAGMCPGLEGYQMTGDVAKRYAELCEGEVESAFDRMLREKVYPILAWVQSMPGSEHSQS